LVAPRGGVPWCERLSRALQFVRSETAFLELSEKRGESVRYRLVDEFIIHGTQVMADSCLCGLVELGATRAFPMSEPLRCCPGQPTFSCH
jgi:hypothetical protein